MFNTESDMSFEPLQNCLIRYLKHANNFFHAFYPGIIRYTPQFEHIDSSADNNWILLFAFSLKLSCTKDY